MRRAEADMNAARDVFETFRDDLAALLAEVRAGRTARAKKLVPIVTELAKAVARLADEEGKLHGARRGRDRAGADGDLSQLSLDLDAARSEVCRRLARLRAAGS
ncbi:MAG: hypothetical protein V2I65_19440 [Paracoccaceae bacterium]|nr:hypothetical protein [Paracoccaceae bacterium]